MKRFINFLKEPSMKKPAFTMLELVFVIVVLGILAALAMPRLDRDLKQEATDNILSAIRYTQHLALIDDKTDPTNPNWQANLWNISFLPNGTSYTIRPGTGTAALDPINGQAMDGTSPNTLIGKKYSVNGVSGCNNLVAFDNLGRPFTAVSGAGNNYANYMTSNCTITVSFVDLDDLNITISAETGHVSVD